jgi:hypothetical protein
MQKQYLDGDEDHVSVSGQPLALVLVALAGPVATAVDEDHDRQLVSGLGVLGREDVEVEAVLHAEGGRLDAGLGEGRRIAHAAPRRGGLGDGEALRVVAEGDAQEGAGDVVLDKALDAAGLSGDDEHGRRAAVAAAHDHGDEEGQRQHEERRDGASHCLGV